jgi:hypothetical protein
MFWCNVLNALSYILALPMHLIFQYLMNDVFCKYLDDFVICYVDDILVFSNNKENYAQHVHIVLDKLK